MKHYLKIVLLVAVILFNAPRLAIAEPETLPFEPAKPPATPTEAILKYAKQYSVPAEDMLKVANCESHLNTNAINSTKWEYSVGIAQINLKAHKNITEEQAKDFNFSAKFMAQEFAKGNQGIWSCSRIVGII